MTAEVIAEIGINHQNDLDLAKRLIDVAKAAGADIVKFQASTVTGEVSYREAPNHFRLIRSVVPSFEFLEACKAHCDQSEIEFLCTPAEEKSLQFLVDLGVKRIKIGSDNLNNPFLLEAAKKTLLPIILSTGMATDEEIGHAATEVGYMNDLTLLHCVSAYPAPIDQVNLMAIPYMAAMYPYPIGFSDHTRSIVIPAVAVGLGAVMIEKHITLDTSATGPDHAASLLPFQFAAMVETIRETEAAMGDGGKRVMPCEEENRKLMRKSLVAKKAIKAGARFTRDNVTAKRPGTGYPPTDFAEMEGKPSPRDYEADELIK